jgi:ribosomal protein S18 acetylase RimI-like enzyme
MLGVSPDTLPVLHKAVKEDRDIFLSLRRNLAKDLIELGEFPWKVEHDFISSAYLFDQYVNELLPGITLIAQWQDDVAGFGMVGALSDYTEGSPKVSSVHGIYTHPAYRRTGLAKRITLVCTSYMANYGFNHTLSEVLVTNTPVIQMAKRLGFRMHSVMVSR